MSVLDDVQAASIPHECGMCGYPYLNAAHAPICFTSRSTTSYNARCKCERCAYLTAREGEMVR